jgi:hypothetical protein
MITKIVVPWYNHDQIKAFLKAWNVSDLDTRFVFQLDTAREGCAVTKNRGIQAAIHTGADSIIVLDDDCFPHEGQSIEQFMADHESALKDQHVDMFECVTSPPSRGTPYFNRTIAMPVAASMGFWSHIGDYDAPGQLVHGATKPMEFSRKAMYGKHFPLCGMNLAFRVSEFPWCKFIDVPRFDDIWQGFLWQKKAYSEGKCFNLNGPLVRHSRQSNVWKNLNDEAPNFERNETIWQDIHKMAMTDYESMKSSLGLK